MTQNNKPTGLQDPFSNKGFKSIRKAISASLHQVADGMSGKRLVYPTKWARLNKNLLGGLQPGKMYVIAGRPGVGKSAFSNQWSSIRNQHSRIRIQYSTANNQ